MAHEGMSGLLGFAEVIHWLALLFMVFVYSGRLLWLFHFKSARDRQMKAEKAADRAPLIGGLFSLGNVAMPWIMESTRKGLPFYASFLVFHLGVTAGIWLAFVSSLYRPMHENRIVAISFMIMIALAFLVSITRIVRRLVNPAVRLISSPDDYFAVVMLSVWFALGVLAQAHLAGMLACDGYLAAYLLCTSFFLVYVPFSKISHYLYYPLARFWIGRTLGHRGAIPAARVRS